MSIQHMIENQMRFDVINKISKFYNHQSFLEIGYLKGDTFNNIKCPTKNSVDPNGSAEFTMTSDEFFNNIAIPNNDKWDLIFIDGDHEKNQVKKDILNSLKCLNSGGTVICHDMSPPSEMHLKPRYCNNSWEAFAELRQTREDLEMFVVDGDCGCGIIRKGEQSLYKGNIESGWEFYNNNKREVLNWVTFNEFTKKYD